MGARFFGLPARERDRAAFMIFVGSGIFRNQKSHENSC